MKQRSAIDVTGSHLRLTMNRTHANDFRSIRRLEIACCASLFVGTTILVVTQGNSSIAFLALNLLACGVLVMLEVQRCFFLATALPRTLHPEHDKLVVETPTAFNAYTASDCWWFEGDTFQDRFSHIWNLKRALVVLLPNGKSLAFSASRYELQDWRKLLQQLRCSELQSRKSSNERWLLLKCQLLSTSLGIFLGGTTSPLVWPFLPAGEVRAAVAFAVAGGAIGIQLAVACFVRWRRPNTHHITEALRLAYGFAGTFWLLAMGVGIGGIQGAIGIPVGFVTGLVASFAIVTLKPEHHQEKR